MTLRVCVGAVATLIALGALAPAARAGAPADRLRQFFGAANAIIADEATAGRPQEKLESIRRLVRGLFGFREAAEHALGAEWVARTPAERAEFVALFTEVAESSFVSAIASRARLDGGARVTVLDETEAVDAATVRTAVAAKMGGEMRVDYRMRLLGGRWVVSDVAVDGVSLMDNYRAQVRRVIERSSYAGLLSEMRARARGAPGGAVEAEVAALPAPPGRSQTAAVAAPTVVDAGSGPAAPLAARVLAGARALAPVAPPMAAGVPESAPRNGVPSISADAVPPAALAGAIVAPAPSRGRMVTMTAAAPAPPPVKMAAAGQPASLAPSPPARVKTAAASRPATRVVPPPRPTLAAPARAARPSFWVQVGAFRTFEAASRVAERLRDQPIAFDISAPRDALLRVLVGPFADHARAATALRGLKARGFQPFIAVID